LINSCRITASQPPADADVFTLDTAYIDSRRHSQPRCQSRPAGFTRLDAIPAAAADAAADYDTAWYFDVPRRYRHSRDDLSESAITGILRAESRHALRCRHASHCYDADDAAAIYGQLAMPSR